MTEYFDRIETKTPLNFRKPIKEARKTEYVYPNQNTKSRVPRNFNASPIERLYNNNTITQSQYEAAVVYRKCYFKAYPTQSSAYKESVDGSRGGDSLGYCMDSEQRIINLGRIMSAHGYRALQFLVIDELEPSEIAPIMKHGWSPRNRKKKLQEVLQELVENWGYTGKKHNI